MGTKKIRVYLTNLKIKLWSSNRGRTMLFMYTIYNFICNNYVKRSTLYVKKEINRWDFLSCTALCLEKNV